MPRPRKSLICLDETPYYHCVSRCVRRAFLCGKDRFSGKSFEHRRQWVENRLLKLASVFAIDVCAYAVMSNHTHTVLRVDKTLALAMSPEEVLTRWHTLHNGTLLTRQFMNRDQRPNLSEAQIKSVLACVEVYRKRLYDISWFMRLLNEFIARKANKEDECTGRFWEGRFKSQALLDESALLACMAYVDLNPIRAGNAKTPEKAMYTSVKRRIAKAKTNKQPTELLPFIGDSQQNKLKGLPFRVDDYLQLVDQTGRQLRSNIKGAIPRNCEPILSRTGLSQTDWSAVVGSIESNFSSKISLGLVKRRTGVSHQLAC
ncbi:MULTISPECIES: transposase [Alteromonas]|jgi:putative transposase|uniref:Transposase n=1 Tax=Alteromonas stellipolaris TaxID=233316 RepID=A0AAW7Z4N2_9ALTE|nr:MULTISPECIES: transposase [Alteromonas]AMJ90637.1 transposase [Alteromonas sp. Mac2]ALM91359.1 Mobile element protein [Alteromonas stellipolaris LMG 21856]AMJ74344.1 transposase [Alteromonas stellipolaris]AMJ86777.1 transposase [Alteromonas sp. Mac1]AMJ94521.1 transposase [Alteromonas stellipolaris]